jgi:hypothetical protein
MLLFAVACMALLVATLDPFIQLCRFLLDQWLGNKFCTQDLRGGCDECVCSDDECVHTDDIADSDVAEDDKEEVNEPLDLFESFVQGFVLSNGRQLWKRKKKQIKARNEQNESKTADERVLWFIPWALSAVGGENGSAARFQGENEVRPLNLVLEIEMTGFNLPLICHFGALVI